MEPAFFITHMPPSRLADYYLGDQEGSVFLDFKDLPDGRLALIRISFDGYGCCDFEKKSTPLDAGDSEQFRRIVEANIDNQEALRRIVRRAIRLQGQVIWQDALEEYGLAGHEDDYR